MSSGKPDAHDASPPAVAAFPEPSKESSIPTWHATKEYFLTRIPSLFDFPHTSLSKLNPTEAIRAMSLSNWNYFAIGFMGWTIDSMDFFVVSACASAIADGLNCSVTDITWGITLVLMLRSVGAFIFGIIADNYGRKWPLIACFIGFVVLEIGTGFVQTYQQFLAVRALFGIFMGACWSLAAATAIEDAPMVSRGFLSGVFLPGYNLGYILAVIFWRAFEFTPHSWRALFWFSAAPPFLLILWRLPFPEMQHFQQLQKIRKLQKEQLKLQHQASEEKVGFMTRHFHSSELVKFFKKDWLLFIYLIIMMSGFNFMSHGSQDLFPTMLTKQVNLGSDAVTVTMVVINLGALVGGLFFGQFTELFGRRFGIICCCIMGGAFIYPTFFLHHQSAIIGAGFFLQFAVMGCWGIAPIHLFELTAESPYRTMISGLAYQLGNLASSASSTIESTIGSRFPLPDKGKDAYNYGKVMAIFMGCVFAFLLLTALVGPEKYHNELETAEMRQLQQEEEDADIEDVVSDYKPAVNHA